MRRCRLPVPLAMAVYTISCTSVCAQEVPDSAAAHLQLREVTVSGVAQSGARVRSDGAIELNNSRLAGMMQAFGEADVMRHLKMMPSIVGNGDYSSGIAVDGTDFSQSVCLIGGAPLFFPYHFGGIFSTFNSRHFSTTKLYRNCGGTKCANRIGAMVDFIVPSAPDTTLSARVSAGLINSGLSLKLPVARGFSIRASARISYFNMLYSRMLKNDDSSMSYKFHDVNLTATYTPGSADCLQLNIFESDDRLGYDELSSDMDISMNWNNALASLQWTHTADSWQWKQNAYISDFGSRLRFSIIEFGMRMPSPINRVGSTGQLSLHRQCRWGFSYDAGYTHARPQSVSVVGYSGSGSGVNSAYDALDCTLSAECGITPADGLKVSPWCKIAAYHQGGYNAVHAMPGTDIAISQGDNFYSLSLGRSVQHLHQVGFSDIGMASNFWIPSTERIKPQTAWSLTADYMRPIAICGLRGFKISAHAYCRLLRNAHEYSGDLISLIKDDYCATDNILTGKGYAWGVGAMLSREQGRLTGWVNYSFGLSRLRFPAISHKMLPSAFDPGHVFTAYGSYKVSDHVDASASWHLASGRRITPVNQIYIIAERVILEHGERNSAHLSLYHRLDLSVNYHFRSSGRFPLRHELSATLFNAYGHKNQEMQTFSIDGRNGTYNRKNPKSLYRFLPSLSYAVEF